MTELVPHKEHSIANVINIVFHPMIICIPTLIILLWDLSPAEMLGWAVIALSVLLIPTLTLIYFLRRRGQMTYQRTTRTPIYLTAMACIVLDLVIFQVWGAPRILTACFATLLVWVPLQLAINTWVTKISVHTAVVTGCGAGLIAAGVVTHPALVGLILALIVLVAWARWVSKNHTVQQIVLGVVVGALPVLVVFPLLLG